MDNEPTISRVTFDCNFKYLDNVAAVFMDDLNVNPVAKFESVSKSDEGATGAYICRDDNTLQNADSQARVAYLTAFEINTKIVEEGKTRFYGSLPRNSYNTSFAINTITTPTSPPFPSFTKDKTQTHEILLLNFCQNHRVIISSDMFAFKHSKIAVVSRIGQLLFSYYGLSSFIHSKPKVDVCADKSIIGYQEDHIAFISMKSHYEKDYFGPTI